MAEQIRFHFDPLCPWCWMTSHWVRQLERLGVVETQWCFLSLALVNDGEDIGRVKGHARGTPALRTAAAARAHGGNASVGAFYLALGTRIHEAGEPADAEDTITAALREAGLPEPLHAEAQADDATWDAVVREHTALVERTQAFGVPTIVLDGDEGPAIFGPVIDELPSDEDAVALWEHVAWLVRHAPFSELKRHRARHPDLESVRELRRRLPHVALT